MNDQKAKLDTLNQIIGMADQAMLGAAAKRKQPAVQPPMAPPPEAAMPPAAPKDELDPEMAQKLMELYGKDGSDEFVQAQEPTSVTGKN
jgi:hypothetical protein